MVGLTIHVREESAHLYKYIYIYKIETFETPTISHISTIGQKKKKHKPDPNIRSAFSFSKM